VPLQVHKEVSGLALIVSFKNPGHQESLLCFELVSFGDPVFLFLGGKSLKIRPSNCFLRSHQIMVHN